MVGYRLFLESGCARGRSVERQEFAVDMACEYIGQPVKL
jgi:hypothetical protein